MVVPGPPVTNTAYYTATNPVLAVDLVNGLRHQRERDQYDVSDSEQLLAHRRSLGSIHNQHLDFQRVQPDHQPPNPRLLPRLLADQLRVHESPCLAENNTVELDPNGGVRWDDVPIVRVFASRPLLVSGWRSRIFALDTTVCRGILPTMGLPPNPVCSPAHDSAKRAQPQKI